MEHGSGVWDPNPIQAANPNPSQHWWTKFRSRYWHGGHRWNELNLINRLPFSTSGHLQAWSLSPWVTRRWNLIAWIRLKEVVRLKLGQISKAASNQREHQEAGRTTNKCPVILSYRWLSLLKTTGEFSENPPQQRETGKSDLTRSPRKRGISS